VLDACIVVRVGDVVPAIQTPRVPAEEDAHQPATCITSGWRLPATPPNREVWLASTRRYVNMLNTSLRCYDDHEE
jgi:hypothetical protein